MKDFFVTLPAIIVVINLVLTMMIFVWLSFLGLDERQTKTLAVSAGMAFSPAILMMLIMLVDAGVKWVALFREIQS